MRFFQSALTFAAVAATAFAQSSVLFFTEQPSSITAGNSVTLHYKSANPTTPTTILLRKGMSTDLTTVQTITDSAVGGSFVWNVPSTLVSGTDYALELTQGSEINYSSLFSIAGSSSSSTGGSMATPVVYGSSTVFPTLKPSHTKAHNSSVILGTGMVGTGGTMPYAYPTAAGTGSGFGGRNASTYASPTLTPGTNKGPTGLVGGPMTTTPVAAGTTAASATGAQKTGAATRLDSSFALIAGAVAAIAYLN